jgi:glycosyltransferase involved in cell wall biosynthesis
MECMACGVPAIVADNTGQRDLVATGAPFPLTRQQRIASDDAGTDGWGESDVDEIVAALEHAYDDHADTARHGAAGAQAMAAWSWRAQIVRLHDVLAPLGDDVPAPLGDDASG